MNRTPAVFTFTFVLDPQQVAKLPASHPSHRLDAQNGITYAFAGYVENARVDQIVRDIGQADWYLDHIDALSQKYGAHGWSSSPDRRTVGCSTFSADTLWL